MTELFKTVCRFQLFQDSLDELYDCREIGNCKRVQLSYNVCEIISLLQKKQKKLFKKVKNS